MKQIKEILISPQSSLYKAVESLSESALQILMVVNESGKLLGTVTDGDIRRSILQNRNMDTPVSDVMNDKPVTASVETTRAKILFLMQTNMIHCIPILDDQGYVVGLETETRLLREGIEDTWVVLMAGGLGMRLRPLTESMPKPLLPINGKPILEGILERFLEQGFRRFYLSVNYKAEMIQEYFGDGAKWGAEISYLHENKRLGTAGALSLLPKHQMPENILVMNGDLLTSLDFRQFLDFHKKTNAQASMCVRDYSIQVPYGVVEVDGCHFTGIKEKPAHSYYINAGIYLLCSSVIGNVPDDEFLDITDLFETLKNNNHAITVFPLREKWFDIGNLQEYHKAQSE